MKKASYVLVALLVILIMGCESREDRVIRESTEQFEKMAEEASEKVDREIKERISEYEQEKDMAILWIQDIYLVDSVINVEHLMEAEAHKVMWFVMLDEDKSRSIELIKRSVTLLESVTVEDAKAMISETESKHDNIKGVLEFNYNAIDAILEEAHKKESVLTQSDYETIVENYEDIFDYTIIQLYPNFDN